MKRKGVRDEDSDKNVSVQIWAKAVHHVRESQFAHQMSVLFSSGPTIHPFPLYCLHRAAKLSRSHVVQFPLAFH